MSDVGPHAELAHHVAHPSPLTPEWTTVGEHRLRLLRDGIEAFPALDAAIDAASTELLLEFYWFGSDALGRRFAERLARRAREGLTVRVLYDVVGSSPVDDDMFAEMRRAGVDVRAYNPLSWTKTLQRFVRRDHRKIVVCDGRVAFTGGLNIGLPWAPPDEGGDGFRDDMVQVDGPAAVELRTVFYETWRNTLTRAERRNPRLLPRDVGKLTATPTNAVWVLANRHRANRRRIRETYLRWIGGAQKSIDVVNAYFLPDAKLKRALFAAVRRGVRVRVMVPAIGDVTFVQWAVEATLERMTKRGIEAFAYTGAILHAKTALVDGALATIGSYNLDARSYRYNLECNLAVSDATFGGRVLAGIERDLARCERWTHEHLRERGFFRRWLGELMRLFANFL